MLLLSFRGTEPPAELLASLREQPIAGVTLFRSLNVASAAQVRALTGALQAARAAGQGPLLVAADQEGGQLMALGDGTPFPGNMALGAARSPELARRVGAALGAEMAAMGVNVNFAPVCDVNTNPRNPVIGTRAFGEDPTLAGTLAAALIEGMQAAGVAATAKHFPGHGDTATDSHHATPVLHHNEARLRAVDWPPFQAAIAAGVRLVMTAHLAVPALDGDCPATLSPVLLQGVLRGTLGFGGVIVSDAMDMGGVAAGRNLVDACTEALISGVDLLCLTTYTDQVAIRQGLAEAARTGKLPPAMLQASAARVAMLRGWLAEQPQPALDVVGCAAHQTLAREVAARSLTLIRDQTGQLPLRLHPDERVAVVVPRPADLTPADTSSYLVPALAEALRAHHPHVAEWLIPLNPTKAEVAALVEAVGEFDYVIIGTINAGDYPGQAALVRRLLERGTPTIVAALRLPYDLGAFPAAPTYLCTYSIQPPAMHALAAFLCGQGEARGKLPVTLTTATT